MSVGIRDRGMEWGRLRPLYPLKKPHGGGDAPTPFFSISAWVRVVRAVRGSFIHFCVICVFDEKCKIDIWVLPA